MSKLKYDAFLAGVCAEMDDEIMQRPAPNYWRHLAAAELYAQDKPHEVYDQDEDRSYR